MWQPGFDPRTGNERFVVDKMALWKVFLQVLRFPLPVTHSCIVLWPCETARCHTHALLYCPLALWNGLMPHSRTPVLPSGLVKWLDATLTHSCIALWPCEMARCHTHALLYSPLALWNGSMQVHLSSSGYHVAIPTITRMDRMARPLAWNEGKYAGGVEE
jgi:hypothetical protein